MDSPLGEMIRSFVNTTSIGIRFISSPSRQ